MASRIKPTVDEKQMQEVLGPMKDEPVMRQWLQDHPHWRTPLYRQDSPVPAAPEPGWLDPLMNLLGVLALLAPLVALVALDISFPGVGRLLLLSLFAFALSAGSSGPWWKRLLLFGSFLAWMLVDLASGVPPCDPMHQAWCP